MVCLHRQKKEKQNSASHHPHKFDHGIICGYLSYYLFSPKSHNALLYISHELNGNSMREDACVCL